MEDDSGRLPASSSADAVAHWLHSLAERKRWTDETHACNILSVPAPEPAWICKQYSEAYFEERGVNMIRGAVDSRDRQVLTAIGLRLIPPDGRSEICATGTACIR